MRFVTISELKNGASSIVHQVEGGDPVVVVRHGKPRAAVIPLKADDLDQLLFESSPIVRKALQEALADLKANRMASLREYLHGKRSA